jgi:hypothetical protein
MASSARRGMGREWVAPVRRDQLEEDLTMRFVPVLGVGWVYSVLMLGVWGQVVLVPLTVLGKAGVLRCMDFQLGRQRTPKGMVLFDFPVSDFNLPAE